MSQYSHTPGPWKVQHNKRLEIAPADLGRIALLAHVYTGGKAYGVRYTVPVPEAEANAQLMAAAPDLLAALQAIAAWCESGDGAHALPWSPPWAGQMYAAINRAVLGHD